MFQIDETLKIFFICLCIQLINGIILTFIIIMLQFNLQIPDCLIKDILLLKLK